MRFNNLHDWLTWQETLNPKTIDLGLDRVQTVLHKLGFNNKFICPVITVGGTNGKGSTVAYLEAMLIAAKYKVGSYTSPHIYHYNERIRINGADVDDATLCAAFEQVDQARGEVALTYFEFGTLAALCIFARHNLDAVVLEVGLGGRLDAVNVIDADVSIITTVAIDHTDWLGKDIESIAREKAGIMRADRPVIYGGLRVPKAVRDKAASLHARLLVAGEDYLYQGVGDSQWQLRGNLVFYPDLPRPVLAGGFQLQNAAAAIIALDCLQTDLPVVPAAIMQGLTQARLAGRFQRVAQHPAIYLDVAHNAQAAQALAELLGDEACSGRTLAVVAMLSDKAFDDVIRALAGQVDIWFSAGLGGPRGLSADLMAAAVKAVAGSAKLCAHQTVAEACADALQQATAGDRIIVLGSFHTVAEAGVYLNRQTAMQH
ncbi:MAG: bifunctional tetrahydrofolate synthase/dihydrofolate synthase [Gammaproteobacteria bacterium]|nr:bifunctional tetrahydrofolate synthase/dihydrofolate synthase [Gammaproteobacteria bacterium]